MSSSTKEEIVDHAILLFNQRGISEVSLRDIANDIGISVGNLTYHFKKKKDLVLYILEKQKSERSLNFTCTELDFEGLNSVLNSMYFHHKKYSYYFDDYVALGKQYPEISETQIEVSNGLNSFYSEVINSFIAKGLFIHEKYSGQYQLLAKCLVMISSFWSYQQVFETSITIGAESELRRIIWNMLIPCFTPFGDAEYKKKIIPTF